MQAFISYIIDDCCTVQEAKGSVIYGILCESEDRVHGFKVHPDYEDNSYHEYYTTRNADFFNIMDRATYGKPTDIALFSKDRRVFTLFLEYTGDVYMTAYHVCKGSRPRPVMVKCTDDILLEFPDELKRNHSVRRFIEAKTLKDKIFTTTRCPHYQPGR